MKDPRDINFRIVEDAPLSSEEMNPAPMYSIYGDFPCGPMWMGQFPQKKTAQQFRWAFRHSRELMYALKHARAILQEEIDSGLWVDEREIAYLDNVIAFAEAERSVIEE